MTDIATPRSTPQRASIAVMGAGFLGEALLRRWLVAGEPAADLLATHRRADRRNDLEASLGLQVSADNPAACAAADVIVIAVRPQELRALASEIAPRLAAGKTVVSLAAAIPLADLRAWLGNDVALCRVLMPPTVATGGGPFFASTDGIPSDERIARVDRLFSQLGARILWVDDPLAEALLVSAGGLPPFVGFVLDAFATWLEGRGLQRQEATGVLIESLASVARQFSADGAFSAGLAHAATPGGLTEAAFNRLAVGHVREDLAAALDAMLHRAAEIRAEIATE